ncbi:protein arginine methyltransferase NDUFAF7, mitochondrial-like isoform X2 [Macrobrachium nipponense]|uniref:protein arginine methyltransferase NDUFAF7, mitochondrial-like isoform X2 n=1 Tax=Macrobrachium nipponense TaxID=159736 RepID=UPI0030C8B409
MAILGRLCAQRVWQVRPLHPSNITEYFKGFVFQKRHFRIVTLLSQSEGKNEDYIMSRSNSMKKTKETPLLKQLQSRIKFTGPLTICDYMKEALINPLAGYYAAGPDMFGSSGDYVTSPEISQMFGEMIGVWVFNEWYKLGSPRPLQLVELGPGRGTLMQDVLRVLKQLGLSSTDVSIHLVEVSPELSQTQEQKLCGTSSPYIENPEDGDYFRKNITTDGSSIFWYRHLTSVPRGFTMFLANEFFDALPVHKFRKTDNGWREVLIDIDEGDGPHHLRYLLSREGTPASKVFIKSGETRDDFEVSPETAVFCSELAMRIEADGGAALIMDYGHNGKSCNTFRAFKNHSLHDPLCEPGTADLTADVDFGFMKEQVDERLITFGPVTQSFFLINMGMEQRLHRLLRTCKEEERKNLISGYKMLTDPKQMGERFKFFAMFPGVVKSFLNLISGSWHHNSAC